MVILLKPSVLVTPGKLNWREKEKNLVLIMSNPIDAVLLLSDLHIPCSQHPGNWAQLMLANHESLILNYLGFQ